MREPNRLALFIAVTLLWAAIYVGCLSNPKAQNTSTDPREWRAADDGFLWYRFVRVDTCDYIEYRNQPSVYTDTNVRLIHKADCGNPIHRGGSK
jgi:hypothetical protein